MAGIVTSEDAGPTIARASIIVYFVAVCFVVLRFVTRGWLVRKWGYDDLFIGIALLFGAGETITLLLDVKYGRGRHSDEVPLEDLNKMTMYKYINMLLYYCANWAVKMSILALYHRMCSLQKGLPWYLRGVVGWSMAAAITAFALAFFLAEMFGCASMTSMFDLESPERKCINYAPLYIAQAGLNCLIDLVLLLFPLPLLVILNIDRRQRYALVIIFSIGLLPLIATIVRLCYVTMPIATYDETRPYGDTSWRWRWIPLWSQIEVVVGIIAACLPSLNPLVKQVWSGVAHSRTLSPSRPPTIIEPGHVNRGDAQGLQKLPSTFSTLPNDSVSTLGVHKASSMVSTLPENTFSTLGELENTKRLTFFDDARNSEDGDDDYDAFSDVYGTTQVGVARAVNTRLSRAAFVDMPASPRREGFLVTPAPSSAV